MFHLISLLVSPAYSQPCPRDMHFRASSQVHLGYLQPLTPGRRMRTINPEAKRRGKMSTSSKKGLLEASTCFSERVNSLLVGIGDDLA